MTKQIEADWNTWAFLPTTTLREAVFLSLDLEPVPQGFNHALVVACARTDKSDPIKVLREFNRRMKIACGNVKEIANSLVLRHRDIENAKVSLSKFGTWAENMKWSLPDKFPRRPSPAPRPTPDATCFEAVAAPAQTTPAPVVVASDGAARPSRRTWRDVAWPYMVGVFNSGRYTTAKAFYNDLEKKAGAESPFDRGTGDNRGGLFVREVSETLVLKTVQNAWPELKASRQTA